MSEVTSSTKIENHNSSPTKEPGFFDLTPNEMEQLAQTAVEKAVERMHSQGIATITSRDGKMFKQYPDGSKKPYSIEIERAEK